MLRLVKMGGVWYAMSVSDVDDDEVESLKIFVSDGEPVLYCDDLGTAAECLLGDIDDIVMV